MPSLQSITENLARAEKQFLAAADTIPTEQWKSPPADGHWSAGELVCHVIQVERSIMKNVGKVLQRPPQPRPFFKRFHLPMALVESRLIPTKTPIPLDPALVGPKEEMLAQLRKVRGRTLSFIEETRGRDLGQYHYPHPFLGTLNLYEWLQMLASHQIRHTKQLKEIIGALQKSIELV